MTHDAAVWLANHITGPNAEKNPFGCFWCGGTVMKHKEACPAYDAIHALDDGTTTPETGIADKPEGRARGAGPQREKGKKMAREVQRKG